MDRAQRQLLYVSNCRRDLPDTDVAQILDVSRKNNARDGVTGVLLHLDGAFLQVLEGDEDAVAKAVDRIRRDPRHSNITVLLDRAAPRAFSEWSMGLLQATPEALGKGGFELTRRAVQGKLLPGAAVEVVTLLHTFYRVNAGNTRVA
jgi:hypothetical protein